MLESHDEDCDQLCCLRDHHESWKQIDEFLLGACLGGVAVYAGCGWNAGQSSSGAGKGDGVSADGAAPSAGPDAGGLRDSSDGEAGAVAPTALYASPTGNGSTCSLALPCSLAGVQSKVRTMTAAMTQDICVPARRDVRLALGVGHVQLHRRGLRKKWPFGHLAGPTLRGARLDRCDPKCAFRRRGGLCRSAATAGCRNARYVGRRAARDPKPRFRQSDGGGPSTRLESPQALMRPQRSHEPVSDRDRRVQPVEDVPLPGVVDRRKPHHHAAALLGQRVQWQQRMPPWLWVPGGLVGGKCARNR